MEKKTYILIAVVSILFVLVLILIPKNPIKITTIAIGSINHKLEKGDVLFVNNWDELIVEYKEKKYEEIPVIYKGITIGSTKDEVLTAFNIKKGYANVNMEVPTKEKDGTTDIIDVIYEGDKSFKDNFLDANITFGYKKENNSWKMLKYKELEKYLEEETTKEDILLFNIDINGMPEEIVDKNEVIMFSIEYK